MILAGIIFGNDRREIILNRLLFKKGGIEKDLIEINRAWEDHIIYSLEK